MLVRVIRGKQFTGRLLQFRSLRPFEKWSKGQMSIKLDVRRRRAP
jgi:hypothetical protein